MLYGELLEYAWGLDCGSDSGGNATDHFSPYKACLKTFKWPPVLPPQATDPLDSRHKEASTAQAAMLPSGVHEMICPTGSGNQLCEGWTSGCE